MTHTSGPWCIIRQRGGNDIGITRADLPNVLAECFADIRKAGENSPEVEANARLIAAAPCLLEALTSVLDGFDDNEADYVLGKTTLDIARAAIARATGAS